MRRAASASGRSSRWQARRKGKPSQSTPAAASISASARSITPAIWTMPAMGG